MAFQQVIVAAVLFTAAVRAECNGLDVKDLEIEPCEGSIIQPSDNTAELQMIDGKCHVKINNPIKVTEDVTAAQMKLLVKKDGVTMMDKTMDYCKEIEAPQCDIGKMMQNYSPKCPISTGDITMPPIDVSKYSGMIPMLLGRWNVDIGAEHDNGKSCAKISFRLAE
ncbi:uncharacterized protein [Anabrus simplex]|uniref:uncharacterized protein n=1 Tax=Anabrus simplex TaxID=316456 RepID=UPI0035A29A12